MAASKIDTSRIRPAINLKISKYLWKRETFNGAFDVNIEETVGLKKRWHKIDFLKHFIAVRGQERRPSQLFNLLASNWIYSTSTPTVKNGASLPTGAAGAGPNFYRLNVSFRKKKWRLHFCPFDNSLEETVSIWDVTSWTFVRGTFDSFYLKKKFHYARNERVLNLNFVAGWSVTWSGRLRSASRRFR